VLEVALAGFEPGDISLTATPKEIIVKATHERRQESEKDGATLRWSEFRSDYVLRRVELPAEVDVNKVNANLKNGLLTIVAPRADGASTATNIAITSGS
jgi:HSP20 family protein